MKVKIALSNVDINVKFHRCREKLKKKIETLIIESIKQKLNFKKLRLDKSLNDNNEELVYKYEKLLNEF